MSPSSKLPVPRGPNIIMKDPLGGGGAGQIEDGGGGSQGGRSQQLRTRSGHGTRHLTELGEQEVDPAQRLQKEPARGSF